MCVLSWCCFGSPSYIFAPDRHLANLSFTYHRGRRLSSTDAWPSSPQARMVESMLLHFMSPPLLPLCHPSLPPSSTPFIHSFLYTRSVLSPQPPTPSVRPLTPSSSRSRSQILVTPPSFPSIPVLPIVLAVRSPLPLQALSPSFIFSISCLLSCFSAPAGCTLASRDTSPSGPACSRYRPQGSEWG
ncbi:hypothetical protein C8J57DRAFT_353274 [Mycena rebaudengoi]|nr:hypothetical protein C8J57DRAFT_353274 [Mycena rebaudengoi]